MLPNLKIISIIPSAENAGTELAAMRTSLLFQNKGKLTEIWTLSNSKIFDSIAKENSLILRNFPIRLTSPFRSGYSILLLIFFTWKYRQVSIFHAYLPKSILTMFILSKLLNITYVAGIRGRIRKQNRVVEAVLGKAMMSAEFIICNAQHLKEYTIARFSIPSEKIFVIRNMVEQQVKGSIIGKEPPTAIVLANFLKYKGHIALLESLKICHSKPNVILIGQGPEELHIRSKILEFNLIGSVLIKPDHELQDMLKAAQFAIHPSETEGFSNAILEEMSYGLPVIAFAVEGNLEVIRNNVNGLLVEPGNVRGLAEAIDTIANNVDTRIRLGQGAKRSASEYSPLALLANLTKVYSQTAISKKTRSINNESDK